MLKNILLFFLLPVLCFASDSDNLTREDIHKVMKQIFSQHVTQKQISGEILASSFKAYMEQFDPEGIYLLESEVAPYTSLSKSQLNEIIQSYNQDDYSIYLKLNTIIQNAIVRARNIRKEIEKNPKALYQEALNKSFASDTQDTSRYADNESELKNRIHASIVEFLQIEVKRFGEKRINGYEPQAIALYEKQIRDYENTYTFTESNGQRLSNSEKENLFTMHILKALAKSLDAHTAFMDNKEADDMRLRLEKGFEGIGIAFQESPQGILVANLIKDGPAAREGQVKVGDLLIEINGTKTDDISFEKAMKLLKGEKNQQVHLVFKRMENKDKLPKILSVDLKRETIAVNDDRVEVTSEKFGDGIIGRITLHSFYQNDQGITSEKDVARAINELKAQGNLRGLILDLRENSGGFLSQAVKVAGLFITNGIVVISKYSNVDEKIYRDMDSKVDYNGPLVVLTSRATASAAEIVAQALQDYGVAVVVGDEQTYGKGTIQSQTVTDNKGGSFFKVTVGKYYTVSGKTPQINGVKADIVVPGPYSNVHLGEEYLDHTLSNKDEITPAFLDPLKDIDPSLRPWYMRYYMPSLQKKSQTWREELTQLQKNTKKRLAENKNYQAFLNLIDHKAKEPLKQKIGEPEEAGNKDFGSSDLQLAETYNIIKDMVYLAPQVRIKEYMVDRDQAAENASAPH